MNRPRTFQRWVAQELRSLALFARTFSWKHPLQFNRNPRSLQLFAVSLFVLGVVSWIDLHLPYKAALYVFYAVPALICAWNIGIAPALWMNVATCFSLFINDKFLLMHQTAPLNPYLNLGLNLVGYISVSLAVSEISFLLRRERALAIRLSNNLKELRQLRRFLPVCAWCKKVRSDEGYWEGIETYISKRTHTKFTHGICPECSHAILSKPSAQPALQALSEVSKESPDSTQKTLRSVITRGEIQTGSP
jgi:hypothetical protein